MTRLEMIAHVTDSIETIKKYRDDISALRAYHVHPLRRELHSYVDHCNHSLLARSTRLRQYRQMSDEEFDTLLDVRNVVRFDLSDLNSLKIAYTTLMNQWRM